MMTTEAYWLFWLLFCWSPRFRFPNIFLRRLRDYEKFHPIVSLWMYLFIRAKPQLKIWYGWLIASLVFCGSDWLSMSYIQCLFCLCLQRRSLLANRSHESIRQIVQCLERTQLCCCKCYNGDSLFHQTPQTARFMGPTWGPPGSCQPQIGPMLSSWTLLSGTTTGKILLNMIAMAHKAGVVSLHLEGCSNEFSWPIIVADAKQHASFPGVVCVRDWTSASTIRKRH